MKKLTKKLQDKKPELATAIGVTLLVASGAFVTYAFTRQYYTIKHNEAIAEMNLIAHEAGLLEQLYEYQQNVYLKK